MLHTGLNTGSGKRLRYKSTTMDSVDVGLTFIIKVFRKQENGLYCRIVYID